MSPAKTRCQCSVDLNMQSEGKILVIDHCERDFDGMMTLITLTTPDFEGSSNLYM